MKKLTDQYDVTLETLTEQIKKLRHPLTRHPLVEEEDYDDIGRKKAYSIANTFLAMCRKKLILAPLWL